MNIKQKALFRYKVGVIRNGKRLWLTPWKNNLILDSGLNKVASVNWANCFAVCIFGNQVAPTPVSRNGGALTFSQSGTTITASGNFFVSQDTGRLFKFDSGEECYLTYVNATTATASISRTVGSGPGTVWYVNQTAVESVFAYSTAYGSNGGDNGTSAIGNVITMKRTYTGAAAGGPTTLTEIGFNDGASNVNIFDRDIIVGGVSILTGDIPLAVAELIMTISQNTPQAVGNVATGYDSSGNFQVVGCGIGMGGGTQLSYVASNGSTVSSSNISHLEPSNTNLFGDFWVFTSTFTIPAFSNGQANIPVSTGAVASGGSVASYSSGNFYRDRTATFNISTGNGTIYGFVAHPGASDQATAYAQKFTSTFTKLSTQTLDFTIRISWQRILVN